MSEVVTSGRAPVLRGPREKVAELWRARELLRQLLGKELKIRYRNSALGFLWSMITPAAMTVVFTVVFGEILRVDIEDYPAFFISGFLVWQFFQNSAQSSLDAIVGNGTLIQKVYFPREVLPLSLVLAQLVHLALAFVVLIPWVAWVRGTVVLVNLPVILLGMVLVGMFTAGFAMLLAGANVGFRDLKELTQILFLLWFYLTPVIIPRALIDQKLLESSSLMTTVADWAVSLNPMSWYISWFQQAIYGDVAAASATELVTGPPNWPDAVTVMVCAVGAVLSLAIGYAAFTRMARTFAKAV